MPRDEAAAIGWPPTHLRLVPDPTPCERIAHLRILIHNATDSFGPNSAVVDALKDKVSDALREAVRLRQL